MTKPSLYFICSRKSSLFLPSIYTCFASTTFRDVRIQALWGPWDPQAQYKMAFRDSPTRSSGNCLLLWLIHFCLFLHRCHCFAQGHLLWSLQVFRNSLSLHWCHYSDSYRTYAEKLDRQHHISAFKLLILMTVSKPGSLTLNIRVCYASYFKEKKKSPDFSLGLTHQYEKAHFWNLSKRKLPPAKFWQDRSRNWKTSTPFRNSCNFSYRYR